MNKIYAILNPTCFDSIIYVFDEEDKREDRITTSFPTFFKDLFTTMKRYDANKITLDGISTEYLEGIRKRIYNVGQSMYGYAENDIEIEIYKEN